MKDVEDLSEFDECAGKPRPPWDGQVVPSESRFVLSYPELAEISALARWLASVSKQSVDLVLNNQGRWVFAQSAQTVAAHVFRQINGQAAWRADRETENLEHWILNEHYYTDRLAEDPSWGRDESGVPYSQPQ